MLTSCRMLPLSSSVNNIQDFCYKTRPRYSNILKGSPYQNVHHIHMVAGKRSQKRQGIYADNLDTYGNKAIDTMGLITGTVYHIGALVTGVVIGIVVDQHFKIPKVWQPDELTDKIKQELERFGKDK